MRYLNEFVLLKHFFGDFAAGRYDLVPSLQGKAITVAIDKQVLGVWEYPGTKATQIVWTSNADGVQLQTSMIPGALNLNSSLNTSGHLTTLVQDARLLLHHHLVLMVGTQDHALALPADDLCVSELTLTLGRPMATDYTNCSQNPMEPIENDFLNFRLAVTFPRFRTEEEQIITWRQNYTRLHASLAYTHPVNGRTKTIIIPNLVFVTATAPTTGPGPRVLSAEASISQGKDVTTSDQVSFQASDRSINLTGGAFPALYPGATVTVSGAATAGNNGAFVVATWAPAKMTLTADATTIVDEAVGATVTVSTSNPPLFMLET
jgi:hypothetical protein